MSYIDEYLLEEERKRREAVNAGQPTLDELMGDSYTRRPLIMPATPTSRPVRQEIPQPTPQSAQTFRSALNIPEDVRNRARISGFLAQLSNAAGGLGRSGRNYRADPQAAERARSAVIGDYVNRQQADIANQQQQQQLDLAQRRQELAERPKPIDPIAQAQALMNLRKSGLETKIKQREVDQAGKEEEHKRALAEMLVASGKIDKSIGIETLMSMSIKTLESMGKDVGLSELDLKKARAQGGLGSGKNIAYNAEVAPSLAKYVKEAAATDAAYLTNPSKQKAYNEVMNSTELSAKQKREIIDQQGWDKEIKNERDRDYAFAEDILNKVNDPKTPLAELLTTIRKAKALLAKNGDKINWNEGVSTMRSLGGNAGKVLIDGWLSVTEDQATKDLLAELEHVTDTFGRYKTGANMPASEAASFERQLQAASFSNKQALMRGLDNADRIIRETFLDTWNTVPRRTQPAFFDRVKQYLPRNLIVTEQEVQAVANKYKVK